jgi:hypothetical protein
VTSVQQQYSHHQMEVCYAVVFDLPNGFYGEIFPNWSEAERASKGVPGATPYRHTSKEEAKAFIQEKREIARSNNVKIKVQSNEDSITVILEDDIDEINMKTGSGNQTPQQEFKWKSEEILINRMNRNAHENNDLREGTSEKLWGKNWYSASNFPKEPGAFVVSWGRGLRANFKDPQEFIDYKIQSNVVPIKCDFYEVCGPEARCIYFSLEFSLDDYFTMKDAERKVMAVVESLIEVVRQELDLASFSKKDILILLSASLTEAEWHIQIPAIKMLCVYCESLAKLMVPKLVLALRETELEVMRWFKMNIYQANHLWRMLDSPIDTEGDRPFLYTAEVSLKGNTWNQVWKPEDLEINLSYITVGDPNAVVKRMKFAFPKLVGSGKKPSTNAKPKAASDNKPKISKKPKYEAAVSIWICDNPSCQSENWGSKTSCASCKRPKSRNSQMIMKPPRSTPTRRGGRGGGRGGRGGRGENEGDQERS